MPRNTSYCVVCECNVSNVERHVVSKKHVSLHTMFVKGFKYARSHPDMDEVECIRTNERQAERPVSRLVDRPVVDTTYRCDVCDKVVKNMKRHLLTKTHIKKVNEIELVEPADEPADEPVVEPVVEPVDEPVDEPTVETTEQSFDDLVESMNARPISGLFELYDPVPFPSPNPPASADSIIQEIDILTKQKNNTDEHELKEDMSNDDQTSSVKGKVRKQRVFCEACQCRVSNMDKHIMSKKHQRCVELAQSIDDELNDF